MTLDNSKYTGKSRYQIPVGEKLIRCVIHLYTHTLKYFKFTRMYYKHTSAFINPHFY